MIKTYTTKNRGKPTFHGSVSVWNGKGCIYRLHVDVERLTREDALVDAEILKSDLLGY